VIGELGHERKAETAVVALLEAIWGLELARSLDLDFEAIPSHNDPHLDLALHRGMLDGVGDGLRAGDGDVEDALLGEASLRGDLGYQSPPAGNLS
jgi:hypothetical protein